VIKFDRTPRDTERFAEVVGGRKLWGLPAIARTLGVSVATARRWANDPRRLALMGTARTYRGCPMCLLLGEAEPARGFHRARGSQSPASQLPADVGAYASDRDDRGARIRPDRKVRSAGETPPALPRRSRPAEYRGGMAVSWRSILGVVETSGSVGPTTQTTEMTELRSGGDSVISGNSLVCMKAFDERAEFDCGHAWREAEGAAARAQGCSNVVDIMEGLKKARGRGTAHERP
jgi:hypothetical protein